MKWETLEFKIFQIVLNPGFVAIFDDEGGEFASKLDFIGLARVTEKFMEKKGNKDHCYSTTDMGTELVGVRLDENGFFDIVNGSTNFIRMERVRGIDLSLDKLKQELEEGTDWSGTIDRAKYSKTIKKLAQLGLKVLIAEG